MSLATALSAEAARLTSQDTCTHTQPCVRCTTTGLLCLLFRGFFPHCCSTTSCPPLTKTVGGKFACTACCWQSLLWNKRHQPSSFQKFWISSIPSFPCSSLCKYDKCCMHLCFRSYCYCEKNLKYWIKEVMVQGAYYQLTMSLRNSTENLFARLNHD